MIPKKASSILAKQFILRRSGTYQNQFHRNYTTDGTFGQVNRLVDTIQANRVTEITPGFLSNVGFDMLSLSTGIANNSPIAVPNQWGNQRGIFILLLEVDISTGGRINYFVQGYTDSDAFTEHHIDPNMRLYINNVVTAIPTQIEHQGNRFNSMRVSSNFQTPVDFGTAHGFSPAPLVMSRPQDIFGQMKINDLSTHDVFVSDKASTVASNLVSTRRRNNIPTSFVSSVFNSYAHGRAETNSGDFTSGDVAEHAFGVIIEQDAVVDMFLSKLRESNGSLRPTAHFTFGELCRAVPNVESIKNLIRSSNVGMQLNQAGDSNHFAGQTISTVSAVQLASAIPTLMLECMLSTISVKISNLVSGQMDMAPLSVPTCFAPDVMQQQYNLFRKRVLLEVIHPMTQQGQINFDATITCSFHSEFVCDIKMGDDPPTRFVTPAFCDSLYAPTVTNNQEVVRNLTSSLSVLCDHVAEAMNGAQLRKDVIIGRQLSGNMTGALHADNGNAFSIPPVVNTQSHPMQPQTYQPKANDPMAVRSHAAQPAQAPQPTIHGFKSGPSLTSM